MRSAMIHAIELTFVQPYTKGRQDSRMVLPRGVSNNKSPEEHREWTPIVLPRCTMGPDRTIGAYSRVLGAFLSEILERAPIQRDDRGPLAFFQEKLDL